MPSLCSSEAHHTSLRLPREPSSLTRYLGTMNSEIPDPGRRIGRARQHQVDDVLGQVVLAVGDEDLLAAQAVAAIVLPHRAWPPGPGPSRPAARSGSWCRSTGRRSAWARRSAAAPPNPPSAAPRSRRRSAWGTAKTPGWPPGCFLPPAPPRPWAGPARPTSADAAGLASPRRIVRETLAETRRGGHLAVVPDRRLGIAGHVQRRDGLLHEARVLFEDGVHQVRGHFFEPGQFQDFLQPGQLIEREAKSCNGVA